MDEEEQIEMIADLRRRVIFSGQAANFIISLLAEKARLREALDQLLDDMGEDGLCVCPAAKEQARAALHGEPG